MAKQPEEMNLQELTNKRYQLQMEMARVERDIKAEKKKSEVKRVTPLFYNQACIKAANGIVRQ